MALVGYFIVFSFVTKPGQTLEFLLWGTIVPLNFLVGYHCSIVASTHTCQHCTWRTLSFYRMEDIPHHLNGTYRGEDNKHKITSLGVGVVHPFFTCLGYYNGEGDDMRAVHKKTA